MLFQMVEILFGLLVWNSNGELRRTAAIPSPSRYSGIAAIFTVSKQQICVWFSNCYFYSENNIYYVIPNPSKHTRLRIGIVTVQPNTNLLFRNSKNSCYSAIPMERWNSCLSSQLSIIIPNKQSKQHF
jgi:hypothetical protein